ncbi:MAG: efflux RND transporter periplasmic adaptor subunit [Gammaproteobacteria bacterium]|jgi:membrane fusion protein (multidrug efflux system)
MSKRVLAVVVVLILLFAGLFGVKYFQVQQKAGQSRMPPASTVAVTMVEQSEWQPYLESVGTLVATQEVFVSTEVAGLVRAIEFESGEQVQAGSLMVQLDDSVDQAELDGLAAERLVAQQEYRRAEKLVNDNLGSKSAFDRAKANLQNAQAQLEAKRARLEQKAIRAPFSGQLGIREVNLGQYLDPGEQIASLQQLDPIFVDFALPERDQSSLALNQPISIRIKARPGVQFSGAISAIDPRIDRNTRSVRIRATLANPDRHLLPGMFAEVRTLLPVRSGILTLPRTAITYNTYGDAVFVVQEKDGVLSVEHRQVETGEVRDGRVEITKGLSAGERVVSAGHVKLRNGAQVVIDETVKLDKTVSAP